MDVNSLKYRVELAITVLSLLTIIIFPAIGFAVALLAILVYLTIGKTRVEDFRSIGFKSPPNWWSTIIICLFLGIAIEVGFQVFINPLLEMLTASKIDLSQFETVPGNVTNFLIWIVIGWIVGGLFEEIVFRGFLITRISSLFKDSRLAGDITGIVLTSVAFGISHMYQGWSGVLSTGLIAALFGIIFIRSNKVLWYPILTHGFVNMAGFTILFYDYGDKLNNLIF